MTLVEKYSLVHKMNKGFIVVKPNKDEENNPGLYEFVYTNDAFNLMFGAYDQIFIGKQILDYITIKDVYHPLLVNALKTGKDVQFEGYFKKLDQWFDLSVYRPEEGYLAVILNDITERKKIEEELKRSQKNMDVVLDITGSGIWEWELHSDKVKHNKKWLDILGLDDEYLTHEYNVYVNHIHPDDREKVMNDLQESLDSCDFYQSEYRMIRNDGQVIWVMDRGVSIFNSDGKVERMVGSINDITEIKMARKNLYLEKEFFQSTLISVEDGIIVGDVNGQIKMFNPAAEKLTGWQEKEVIDEHINKYFQIFDKETKQPLFSSNPFATEDTGDSFVNLQNKQVIIKNRSGQERIINTSISAVRLPSEECYGFVIVFSDVTELAKEQKQIEYLSTHDELTGLYNRRYMQEHLVKLDETKEYPFTLMILDLNYLKKTNDTYGHAIGDRLIKKATGIFKDIFRENDIIARIGGDEFGVLLPKTSEKDAEIIKKRIIQTFETQTIEDIQMSVAIGYATKTKPHQDIEKIMQEADANMYSHKNEMR